MQLNLLSKMKPTLSCFVYNEGLGEEVKLEAFDKLRNAMLDSADEKNETRM